MDPLSISVSAIAIIGAIRSSLKVAKSIYKAPEEIDSFLNDLTEADLIIRDIQSSLEHGQPFTGPQTAAESAFGDRLKATKAALSELEALVEKDSKLYSSSSSTTQRLVWPRVLRKTKKLRVKLAEVHSELPRRLGQFQNHRIRLEITGVSLAQDQLRSSTSKLESQAISTTQHLSRIRQVQEEQNRTRTDITNALQILPRVLSPQEEDNEPHQFSTPPPLPTHSADHKTPSIKNFDNARPLLMPTTALTYESIIIKGR